MPTKRKSTPSRARVRTIRVFPSLYSANKRLKELQGVHKIILGASSYYEGHIKERAFINNEILTQLKIIKAIRSKKVKLEATND